MDKLALKLDAESLGHKLLNLCNDVDIGVVDKLVGNDGQSAENIAGKVNARKLALTCGQCGKLCALICGGDVAGRRIGRGVGTVDRYGQSALGVVLCGLFNNRRYVDYIGDYFVRDGLGDDSTIAALRHTGRCGLPQILDKALFLVDVDVITALAVLLGVELVLLRLKKALLGLILALEVVDLVEASLDKVNLARFIVLPCLFGLGLDFGKQISHFLIHRLIPPCR